MKVILRKKPRYGVGLCWLAAGVAVVLALIFWRDPVRDLWVDDTKYAEEIREAAARHGLPPELVRAVIFRESRFDPAARGKAGEVGLMQVLPSGAAAEWARVRKCPAPSVRELYDVRTNLEVGCFYLAKGMRRWQAYQGRTALALCQYNAGESRAVKWRPENPQDADILPRISIRSTREYVRAVLKRYWRYCEEQKK